MTISAVVTETEINASVTQLSNSVALTETEINASVSQTPISANVTSSPVSASVTAGTTISVAISQSTISASITSNGGSGGVTNHALLTNLDYASAGHTGFQATLTADVDYLTPATAALTYQPIGSYLTDAPSDGTTYGRNNGAWTAVSSGVSNHALLSNLDYASAGHTGFQAALSFPLAANLGGTGIANLAGSTLTLGGATTVPSPGGTVALLATANVFTAAQTIDFANPALPHFILGDTSADYVAAYRPEAETSSYTHTGGQGNRTSIITVTSTLPVALGAVTTLVNGNKSESVLYWTAAAVSGLYLRFQFANRVLITEATWYQDRIADHGTWRWQGSNDSITWVNIGNTFTLGGGALTSVQTELSGNTTKYLYYQLLGVSGTSGVAYQWEIEFSIYDDNPTIIQGYTTGSVAAGTISLNPNGGTVRLGGKDIEFPSSGIGALAEYPNIFTQLNTFTNIKLSSGAIYPSSDGTSAIKFTKADGSTSVMSLDTTNKRVGINTTTPARQLHVVVGSTSGAATNSATAILLDSNDNAIITMATPNTKIGGFYFADPQDSVAAYFNYDHSIDLFSLKSGKTFYMSGRADSADNATTCNLVKFEAEVLGGSGAAAGFGIGLLFYAETATNLTNQQQGLISTSWIDATNVSRKAKMSLSAYDTAARLGLEIEADGSAAKIGVLGATPIVRQAHIVNADGTLADVTSKFNSLLAYLENFGFIATS